MDQNARIYVAGHRGLVGSAIIRRLKALGYENLLLRTHAEVDLTDHRAVQKLFFEERPDHVILAAAKVGGILANNTFPAEFLYENLRIAANVIHEASSTEFNACCFLDRVASIPSTLLSPSRKARSLAVHWSRRTGPTLWQRLLVSKCAGPTIGSIKHASSQRCPPTCTD